MKFVKNPGPGWNFQPLTNVWDPDFIEGGFDVPELEATAATPFIVASDRFFEKQIGKCRGIGFVNEVGKGRVILLASLDSPGAFGVRKLYSFLMAKAMEAVGTSVWPKVECADTVRWSVYPDGTVYLLNTEAHLAQKAVVEAAPDAPQVAVDLLPGEVKAISASSFIRNGIWRCSIGFHLFWRTISVLSVCCVPTRSCWRSARFWRLSFPGTCCRSCGT